MGEAFDDRIKYRDRWIDVMRHTIAFNASFFNPLGWYSSRPRTPMCSSHPALEKSANRSSAVIHFFEVN